MRKLLLYGLMAVSASAQESVTEINVENITAAVVLTETVIVAVDDRGEIITSMAGPGSENALIDVLKNDLRFTPPATIIEGADGLKVVNVRGEGCQAAGNDKQVSINYSNGFIGKKTCTYQAQYNPPNQPPVTSQNSATVTLNVLPPATV